MADTTIEIPQPSWIREPPEPDVWDDDDEPEEVLFAIKDGVLEFIVHQRGDAVVKWDPNTKAYVKA